MSPPSIPVTIRGVSYHSMSAAARALGVSISCVYQARRDGNIDRPGLYPMKGSAIIALLAKASPDDLPRLQHQARLWLDLSAKRSRK